MFQEVEIQAREGNSKLSDFVKLSRTTIPRTTKKGKAIPIN